MKNYQVHFRWDLSHAIPLLLVTVSGRLLSDPTALPAIIDQAHACAEDREEGVYIVYDFRGTEGKLPLHALMRHTRTCRRVRQVAVVGARARSDEMAFLIMGAAKRVPYGHVFFKSPEEAIMHLRQEQD
jgi:hypothetical protein